jgi:hypothetical protein
MVSSSQLRNAFRAEFLDLNSSQTATKGYFSQLLLYTILLFLSEKFPGNVFSPYLSVAVRHVNIIKLQGRKRPQK